MSETSDRMIVDKIMETLLAEEIVDPTHIEIDCQDGNVTLSGTVSDEEEFREAEFACWVEDVESVENRLVVYVGSQFEES